jgi:hypothetical protein
MAHTYNPNYLGGRNLGDLSSRPILGKKKFVRPHLNRKKLGNGGMHLTSQLSRYHAKKTMVQASPGKKRDPITRTTKAIKTRSHGSSDRASV